MLASPDSRSYTSSWPPCELNSRSPPAPASVQLSTPKTQNATTPAGELARSAASSEPAELAPKPEPTNNSPSTIAACENARPPNGSLIRISPVSASNARTDASTPPMKATPGTALVGPKNGSASGCDHSTSPSLVFSAHADGNWNSDTDSPIAVAKKTVPSPTAAVPETPPIEPPSTTFVVQYGSTSPVSSFSPSRSSR